MISQRPAGAAPAVQASAEDLPFEDDSLRRGDGDDHGPPLARPRSRAWGRWPGSPASRVVILSLRPGAARGTSGCSSTSRAPSRSTRDFMPPLDEIAAGHRRRTWRSRRADPARMHGRLLLRALGPAGDAPRPGGAPARQHGLACDGAERDRARSRRRLRADLESGRWDERHGHLRERTAELDLGLRLLVAELG